MGTLVGYEAKKIIGKKSTLAAFLVLFLLHIVFVCISGSLGSTYVEDSFYETHQERNRIDRVNGSLLSGRKIDEIFLNEMEEAYAAIDWNTKEYMWTDFYQENVRKYSDLEAHFKYWGLGSDFAYGDMTEKALYEKRENYRDAMWENYGLSEKEVEYWQEKDAKIEVPFTYEYAATYESMLDGQGIYMMCMILTFFIAISMVSVFTEEHNRKTDQLILCARYGRGKLYMAKILAGSLVVFLVNLIFLVTAFAGKFYSYGPEGFDAAIQFVSVFWYSYPMSVGEVVLISCGLLLLSSILVAIFTMLLAEILKNSVGAMAVVVGMLLAARLVVLPPSWGILSRLWSYLPINLLKVDEGFTDLRLVNLCGVQLTTWQFAPILYLVLIAGMVWAGSRIYRNYQVSGR